MLEPILGMLHFCWRFFFCTGPSPYRSKSTQNTLSLNALAFQPCCSPTPAQDTQGRAVLTADVWQQGHKLVFGLCPKASSSLVHLVQASQWRHAAAEPCGAGGEPSSLPQE